VTTLKPRLNYAYLKTLTVARLRMMLTLLVDRPNGDAMTPAMIAGVKAELKRRGL
jgi:hypothetical protein